MSTRQGKSTIISYSKSSSTNPRMPQTRVDPARVTNQSNLILQETKSVWDNDDKRHRYLPTQICLSWEAIFAPSIFKTKLITLIIINPRLERCWFDGNSIARFKVSAFTARFKIFRECTVFCVPQPVWANACVKVTKRLHYDEE